LDAIEAQEVALVRSLCGQILLELVDAIASALVVRMDEIDGKDEHKHDRNKEGRRRQKGHHGLHAQRRLVDVVWNDLVGIG